MNPNYAATVCRLPDLLPLEGADFLVGAPLFGFQAIVSKDHQPGELGVVFPAETQLSDELCRENNLYRHAEKNKDDEQGYLEDSRRVRAIKLRGHRSDCLWLPIQSLAYTGADLSGLNVGDTFDQLNGHRICKKYVVRQPSVGPKGPTPKVVRVDPRLFPPHLETENYWKNSHLIDPDALVWVTQKIHGTSWRGTRTLVRRHLTLRDRVAKRLGIHVLESEWDAVAGSRKVVKDPHDPTQRHYYETDIWTTWLDKVEHLIPRGYIFYGEIVGWVNESTPIQANYTYHFPPGQNQLYIYRIAVLNDQGVLVDLAWPQVVEFCAGIGLPTVPTLWSLPHEAFKPEAWVDRRFYPVHDNALPLSDPKTVDEGVCVRADGLTPTILKCKSPIFLGHESKLLDKGVADLESAANETVDA